MSLETAIISLINADVTLVGLLSTRWYPLRLPENPTYPSGTYQQISDLNISSHQGNSNLADTRLQLTIWTTKYSDGVTIRDELKRVLRDFKGTVGSDRLDRVEWANDLTMLEPETQKHQRVIDLLVWHNTVY